MTRVPPVPRVGDSQFFTSTVKLEQVQKQLDSDSFPHKLEGLKKLVGMICKGKDVSSMFPHVVKNVVNENLEVKKLVYSFLIHYAEVKPDEALLSVSHFQKDMRDKNQFIRASALRVLSSVRVPIIGPIVMIAIKQCASDSSPFVRKVSALAIPKVYSVNESQKDSLIQIIETLLADTNTIVIGAAVFAFSEVCPEKYELLHKHYRRICRSLIDCDEWGQVAIMNVFLRYARANFLSPFGNDYKRKIAFYAKDDDEEEEEDDNIYEFDMDPDHRLLLKSVKPLLQSHNSAVVLTVASIYFHCAPPTEFHDVVKAVLRILRSDREPQYVVLVVLSAMCTQRTEAFQNYVKNFYIGIKDPLYIREMKLNIMATLACQNNASSILKEFRTYVKHADKTFVKQTIQSIGRIASSIPEIADQCLGDLLSLINNKKEREEVVAEAVIITRHLLQKQTGSHAKIIRKLIKLLDNITVPIARSSIIWLIGEYHSAVPKMAPDAFRRLTANFINEAVIVKAQILGLGTKLYFANLAPSRVHARVEQILKYVLTLGKYDVDYDIRDRTRLIRELLFSDKEEYAELRERARDMLCVTKSLPNFDSRATDQSRFQLASLSHIVNHTATGYCPLPEFPQVPSDSGLREMVVESRETHGFSSSDDDSESSSEESSSSESESGSDDESESGSDQEGSKSGSEKSSEKSKSASASNSRSNSDSGSESDSD